ncbi:MAG: alpha/beta hydrolase [Polyangia bacterium]
MHGVVTVECHSPALDRTVTYTALVPDGGTPPFAVLYQLHGASDDHRAWLYKSNLLRVVEGLPLLVVLPSGENGYYVDAPPLRALEQLVVHDIPAHVTRTFRVKEGRAAIGGLSMGGYGAIRLGLKHPDRYASVFAHSSRLPARAELPMLAWTHGIDDADLDDLDVDRLAQRIDPATMPKLAFDCGVDDHLIADSRRFHARLEALGVPHGYAEHAGAHDWEYWNRHVSDAIAHHARVLGL